MRTRFECVIWQKVVKSDVAHETNQASLKQEFAKLCAIVESAFAEIHETEARLSPFLRGSQISRINASAHERPVAVDSETFSLLRLSQWLHASTGGAFDLTMGPLMRAWGFRDQQGDVHAGASHSARPVPGASDSEHAVVWGMDKLLLDPSSEAVAFTRPGLSLDLGAIGKGHALDLAMAALQAAGITDAIIHAGTSSIRTIGQDYDFDPYPLDPKCLIGNPARPKPWRFAIQGWRDDANTNDSIIIDPCEAGGVGTDDQKVTGAAIGVSAQRGRTLMLREPGSLRASIGHIMDPRSGQSASSQVLTAAVVIPTFSPSVMQTPSHWELHAAAIADALSTAALVLGFAPTIPAFSLGPVPVSGQRPIPSQEPVFTSSYSGKIGQAPTYPRWRVYLQGPDNETTTWTITDSALCH